MAVFSGFGVCPNKHFCVCDGKAGAAQKTEVWQHLRALLGRIL